MPLNTRLERVSQDDWSCAAVRSVFSTVFYSQLVAGLNNLEWSEAIQTFYRQREVNLQGDPYYDALFNDQVRVRIAHSVGLFFGENVSIDFDVAAHKMINGDYIGPHTDANDHGETHRLTVTLNDGWEASDGGVLLSLNDGALSSIRDAWLPTANNGFLFEISEQSYHAVSPIVGQRPRYSLILTFKRLGDSSVNKPVWMPFVLQGDLEDAMSTAAHMGISAHTFEDSYQFFEFPTVAELRTFVGAKLDNSPTQWSYRHGKSMNVDQHGRQPKGTDDERTAVVRRLRRIPPILLVRRKTGQFCLVDGSHRLCHANDKQTSIGIAVFDER